MEEKIKISLPKSVSELLQKDCIDFKFVKENGASNMNAFINTLIANYYEEFSASEEKLHDDIDGAIACVPDFYKKSVFAEIVKIFNKRETVAAEEKSVILSFKPTKVAEKAVEFIARIVLQDESLSSFYRRMFTAYSQKTKTEREKIIFSENYKLLLKAIKKNKKVCVTLKNGDAYEHASVFSVSPAKDELFNYVLLCCKKKNSTIRLATIKAVSLLSDAASIPDDNKTLFERQVACAAQYPMYSTDTEPIRVQLTENGKKLFNKIYLYRPTAISVDGDIYTFDCSVNQLLYYFQRFGDSALILSPERVGIRMRDYYYFALKKYRTLYK